MTLLYNAERLGLEVLAAALEPPEPLDLVAFAEQHIKFLPRNSLTERL